MKSNQERSNECLPPKKRELAASTLAPDDRPLATPPASDTQRNENLAWLASVAGGHEGRHRTTPSSAESNGPQYKPLSMSDSSPSYSSSSASYASSSSPLRLVSSLPTIYTSATMAGALHYAPMPHNLQFIASPYPSPYAGYVSSQLLPPPPPPPPPISSASSPSAQHRVSHAEAASNSSQAPKPSEHHHHHHQRSSIAPCTSMPPPSSDYHPVHGSSSSSSSHSSSLRTVQSPSHHHAHLPPPPPPPPPLHAHHKLGRALSQLVVGYIPCRTEEGQARGSRELHNGEQERGRRPGSGMAKLAHKTRGTPPSTPSPSSLTTTSSSSSSPYEAHQLVLPTDYTTHDPSVLRTSFMLMPNSHQDHAPQASGHLDKGGVGGGGKSAHRTLSSSSSSISSPASTFAFPPPPLSADAMKAPHTVIQTTHSATELLPTSGLYPQPPIISYIAGGGGGSQQQHQQQQQLQQQHHHQHHQQSISYHHASLQQHLLIPGSQPVIIPVSGGGVTTMESAASHATSAASMTFPTAAALPPQTYIAGPKREPAERPDDAAPHFHQALRGQLRLTAAAAAAAAAASSSSSSSSSSPAPSPPSLPPYFIKGSIIQLADGDLKRVEELKTEDFIQSAEVSGELKIDSSTVERIDESPASRHLAVVQFSVGEHRAQVSVEVLVEYPFFVFGQGWSSCCPDRTTQLLELPCARLSVGDVCISLALKNLRNGSLKKNQPRDPTTAAASSGGAAATSAGGHGHLKPPARPGSRHGERENGVRQQQQQQQTLGGGAAVKAENGMELRFGGGGDDPGSGPAGQRAAAGAWKPTRGRKRRWSAPEGRKVDKAEEEEELPAALPRPSFLPHDVKVSIEGRSSFGK